MRSDRFEYFATAEDQQVFFSKVDAEYDLKIVETSFERKRGPKIFGGLVSFLSFMREDADPRARRGLYYGCFDPQKLQSTSNSYSAEFASFDLVKNPDVLTFNYGEQLNDRRLLLSQIGRSKESAASRKILSRIKKIAKLTSDVAGMTITGEFVFPSALNFAREGGRLVRTPDSPSAYDVQIAS
jgi:hypothetical protein